MCRLELLYFYIPGFFWNTLEIHGFIPGFTGILSEVLQFIYKSMLWFKVVPRNAPGMHPVCEDCIRLRIVFRVRGFARSRAALPLRGPFEISDTHSGWFSTNSLKLRIHRSAGLR